MYLVIVKILDCFLVTQDDAFEITYRLDIPVRSDLYDYFIQG
jgi:hypothetical protein